MIKAVLFDAGGTLLKAHPSVGRVYAEVAARHGVKTDPADIEKCFKEVWKKQRTKRKLVDKEWWRAVVTAVFKKKKFKDTEAFFEDLYQAFREPSRWKIFPDVIPTLKELKKRNITLAVASNWDERLPRLLRDLSLAPYFDHQFISSLVGHVKPDPAFFKHALKMMGLEAGEVLLVGDDPVEDIRGAAGIGIKAVLLDRTAKRQDNTLSSLSQLLQII